MGSISKYINVQCPEVVREYNKSMGGVDSSDMLISLYRTQVKTKIWYIKVLFHCIDIAKVNAWLLYKRHCMQLERPKRKQKSLLKFISEIFHSLLHRNTIPTPNIGHPSKRMSTDNNTQPEHKKRAASNSQPDFDVRLDCVAHWPEFRKEKRKCRHCKTGQSCIYCMKCDICFCLSGARNCFVNYHV